MKEESRASVSRAVSRDSFFSFTSASVAIKTQIENTFDFWQILNKFLRRFHGVTNLFYPFTACTFVSFHKWYYWNLSKTLIMVMIYGSDFSPAFLYVLNHEREFGNIFLAPQKAQAKILIKKNKSAIDWIKIMFN